jgi:hypothetical protein
MNFNKGRDSWTFRSRYLDVWQEPTWMSERRYWGIKLWKTGAELNIGKLMYRCRIHKTEVYIIGENYDAI